MTGSVVGAHVNAHRDVRRRTRLAAQDVAGYLADARETRRREAAARLQAELLDRTGHPTAADLWLRLVTAVVLLGCLAATLGLVVGITV